MLAFEMSGISLAQRQQVHLVFAAAHKLARMQTWRRCFEFCDIIGELLIVFIRFTER
jgi:hypothetical protein